MTLTHRQTALVTGASSGIGAVYADRLAHRGYDLILVARDQARLDALADRLRSTAGRDVRVVVADLGDGDDLARVAALLDDPSVTLLVNNAGSTVKHGILEVEAGELTGLIAVNVVAPAVLATAAAQAFKQRGRGAIVNIASVLGLAPELFNGAYNATKAYLLSLSRSLSASLADSGVHVQAVLPGATRTAIWDKAGTSADALPAGIVMEVDDLVDAALVGFDRRETVTIPPLHDEALWTAFETARQAMLPHLSTGSPAPRYR